MRKALEFLYDFLQSKDIEKSKIFERLNCTKDEALILQYLTKEYLKGNPQASVFELLGAIYKKNAEFYFLEKIPLVKNLISKGWISLNTLTHAKVNQLGALEILYFSVGLSPLFLKMIERGNLDIQKPKIIPYGDNLEYLQDEFTRIELYQTLAQTRQNQEKSSPGYKRVFQKLKILEEQIEQRVKRSKEIPKAYEYLNKHKLSRQEKIIFLALLKEEYSSGDENLHEMNTLLELISQDEYEKIKNRSLLEESAPLIKNQIIDYDELFTTFGSINRSFFITEDALAEVINPAKKEKKQKRIKLDTLVKEQEIFELIEPKTSLDDVILNAKTKEMISTVIRQMDKTVANRLKEWGIKDKKSSVEAKILFHGTPGTGKTLTALSMARALKKQIVSFDCSKILSMYIGESEKNVRKIFDTYKEISRKSHTNPVLLLDEADQFLSARTPVASSSADKMHNQMQNIFLENIEKFDGVLIATTNLLESFDQAFSRRFNYKIKFERPSLEQRKQLWHKMIPHNAKTDDSVSIDELSKYDLSGGQIHLIVKNTAFKVATKSDPVFTQSDFVESIKKEISGNFGEESVVGFLS
ncbi:MAG: ATP-binding protein [Helicobacteraceae bacterium]